MERKKYRYEEYLDLLPFMPKDVQLEFIAAMIREIKGEDDEEEVAHGA